MHFLRAAFYTLLVLSFAGSSRAGADEPAPASSAAPSPAASAAPSPTPSPTPTPNPAKVSIDPVLTFSSISTSNVNSAGSFDTATGADKSSRTDISNALVNITKPNGTVRYGAGVGIYSFPVVGVAGNKTTDGNANTGLYTALPWWYVEDVPNGSFNVMAGKLGTLIGPEGIFTYQNFNIQRGLLWNMEPVVSRGVRFTGTRGNWTGALEIDDGFYSGRYLGFEGSVSLAGGSITTYQFNFLIPNQSAPSNPTAAVANRRVYNPVVLINTAKWQLQPYLLFVDSPASAALGYTKDEHAFGTAFLADYALSGPWSAGIRIEYAKNGSDQSDLSPNANLLGYGPGSSAWTYTLTPTYKNKAVMARVEFSQVSVANFTPGLGFGNAGTGSTQSRVGFEVGVQY